MTKKVPGQSAEQSGEAHAGCTAHTCPRCGKAGHITVERVIVGSTTVDYCYCKVCGASWVGDGEKSAETQQ